VFEACVDHQSGTTVGPTEREVHSKISIKKQVWMNFVKVITYPSHNNTYMNG
jgi:hypothetical protein